MAARAEIISPGETLKTEAGVVRGGLVVESPLMPIDIGTLLKKSIARRFNLRHLVARRVPGGMLTRGGGEPQR